MTIELVPELGVEIPPDMTYLDLRERAEAACQSIQLLKAEGLEVQETAEDTNAAATLLDAYAQDPTKTSKHVTTTRAASLTPASLLHLRTYLDEFGRGVVEHAKEVRNLVTNRLLEESQNPDPRIRIRALELLGKISDVGLFTERTEVLITHQTTDELREKLREKLRKLTNPTSFSVGTVNMGGEIIDIDAELQLEQPNPVVSPQEDVQTDDNEG